MSVHVIPLEDSAPHGISDDCPCKPWKESTSVTVHHAFDGREKWERQGIKTEGKEWGVFEEDA